MSNDYTQLQADIVSMMARSDLDAPLFIRLAEIQLSRVLRLRTMIVSAALAPTASGNRQTAGLPADFLEALHIEQANRRLNYRSPDTYDVMDPEIYTIQGTELHLTAADGVLLWYYAAPTALSATNPTNIYTAACYDGLLYLSLGHGNIYINRTDKAAALGAAGIAFADAANEADRRAEVSGAALLVRGG